MLNHLRTVDVVSTFAERFVASRLDAPESTGAKDFSGALATESVTSSPSAASNHQPITA